MDQFTFDVWSIGAIIVFAGAHTLPAFWHAYFVINTLLRAAFTYVLELCITFEIVSCIANHLHLDMPMILALLVLSTYITAAIVWHNLSVRWKRWLRMGMILIAIIFCIVWVLHVYFHINALMALRTLWQRFFIPVAEQALMWSRKLWLKALESIAALTWKEGGLLARRFAGQIALRWVKRAVILFTFYQVIAGRMRRIYMMDAVQKFKEKLLAKKTKLVSFYKAMPFWQKIVFCASASVCVFFVSQSWEFFYPFIPKGALRKLLSLLKWVSTRLGVNNLLDRITNFLLKALSIILPIEICLYVERRWHLFKKWRLHRYNILIDRWISVIDRKARDKARIARQVIIANIQSHQQENVNVDGTW